VSDDAGLPPAARERLERLREAGGPAFTSALSVGETLTVRQAGLRPLSQVMGTSYYKIGWQQMPWGSGRSGWFAQGRDGETQELSNQTDAYNEARRLAVGRLREEAIAVGADAVVGVHVRRTLRDWSTDLVEFVAIGTAVRSERYDLGPEPLLCNLSGQDVAKLVSHGFWPVGIVGGSTVAYVVTGTRQQRSTTSFFGSGLSNQELPDYTQGLYDARALAMERVTRGAHELHAHGVVGVDVERDMKPYEREVNNVSYRDLIITMHILGTAIVEMQDGPPPPEKYIALPLT
jgi:uncharacterized protein YbjQ (UPF0145 family)